MPLLLLVVVSLVRAQKPDHIDYPYHPRTLSREHIFPYQWTEATGITTGVIVGGKAVTIKFAPASDPQALDSLMLLKAGVLWPNTSNNRIFVRGGLYKEGCRTPRDPRMAASEKYQEFVLKDWYIVTPFVEQYEGEEWEEVPKRIPRTSLHISDFNRPFSLSAISGLSQHQKTQAQHKMLLSRYR